MVDGRKLKFKQFRQFKGHWQQKNYFLIEQNVQ